ncbi:alpha/beta hydrolase [Bacillus anthracis]|nr:alpha/beta hydrolase [Bacillus anthracis]
MFYSYFASQAGMRPAYGTSITYSGAQSTVQAVQQALQMQQQMQMQQQGIQPYYSSMEYFYPVYPITPYGSSFLTIPYGTVFNL